MAITNDEIIEQLTKNNISIVCVTDHNYIDVQRIRNLQEKGNGKVVVLPGIEFCSELGGSEAIHFIGIFSEKSDFESIWTKLQGKLELTPADIIKRGGKENIQSDLIDTCDIIHGLGGITSIHAGTKTNTIENIKNNLLVKMEQKRRILSECINILELGKPEDASSYNSIVFKSLKFRLPMVICSDNHDIGNYTIKQTTWIKADPTFEGLKQIIYEPIDRVFIGTERPDIHRENCISSITVEKEWFPQKTLPLNNGLVSIIGARGSGKTALLDFIALGAKAYYKYKASFLSKAENKVKPLVAKVDMDGHEISKSYILDADFPDEQQLVKYLSQQFVENLCSDEGSTERLQAEIERFIFENLDDVERLGTTNLSELKTVLCQSSETAIISLKNRILDLNKEISRMHQLRKIELPNKRKEKAVKEKELEVLRSKLPKLDKTIQNESIKNHEIINAQKIKLESELKLEYPQIKEFEKIYNEFLDFNKTIIDRNQYFKDNLSRFGLGTTELSQFDIQYPNTLLNSISSLLESRKAEYHKKYGSEQSPAEGTYKYFNQRLAEIKMEINTYTENERYYLEIASKIEKTDVAIKELEIQIKNIEDSNLQKLQKDRLKLYLQVFEEILREKAILESLYEPLIEQLKKNNQEKQLGFFVKINVNTYMWAKHGENIIDMRKAREFSEPEKLYCLAKEKLFNPWENCDLSLIEKAIDDFTSNEALLMSNYLLEKITLTDLADWLFSTNHISISYEMTFNGIPLKLLSPGTKGVLLMLLYLGVDKNDTRPLLIDQPEDNLDPESVFNVLVPYFIEAKKRRQIIMVTHNPNLVVATDSDQVIIAKVTPRDINQLPIFTYSGGGLENPEIVDKICSILEGGEDAFRKREQRYFSKIGIFTGGKTNAKKE